MNLDFSDLIEDADLGDSFSVIRRTDTVAANGRSVLTEQTISDLWGVVTFSGEGKNTRKEESQTTDNEIKVTTKFRLRAAAEGVQPDIVLYDGIRYTVTSVRRWTRLGTGFVKATAVSSNASDPTPT